jgi:hypothetical protein
MSQKYPIHKVISQVLSAAESPMTAAEIYDAIMAKELYSFPAKDPIHVVRSTLRRHCVNMDFPSARQTKYFSAQEDGRYTLLPKPVTIEPTAFQVTRQGKRKGQQVVSVPSDERNENAPESACDRHNEIQWKLLDLGNRLGYKVWAPINDRGRTWNGNKIGDVPNLLDKLPPQFDPAAMRVISFIDVIWLEQRTLFAAFEVEHTTPIYSGLLRMADLMTLVPNQDLKWFVVSSEDRYARFASQVSRPVFQDALRKPLHSVCSFLSYERLLDRLDRARDFLDDLKITFLDKIAETYDPNEAIEE